MVDFIDDNKEWNILLHIFLEDLFFYFILMDKKIQTYFTVLVYDFMTLKGECCKPFILIITVITYS